MSTFDSQEQRAIQNTLSKAIQICCTTCFFYYSALHFNEEREYIWSKKWSPGKALYLLTRYSGGAFLLYTQITSFFLAWMDTGILQFTEDPDEFQFYLRWVKICIYGYLYVAPGVIIMFFAEVILVMRVYALYGRSKRMLAFLLFLAFILFGFDVIQPFRFPYLAVWSICLSGSCKNAPIKRNLFNQSAGLACNTLSTPMSTIGWLLTSVVELLLFILVLVKTKREKRQDGISQSERNSPQNRDITIVMAKDSSSYFAVIFTVCLVGTVLAFVSQVQTVKSHVLDFISSQLNAYQTVVLTVMTILAPRLLISLRAEFYGPVKGSNMTTHMTWNVAAPKRESDTILDDRNDSESNVRMTLLGSLNRSASETLDTEAGVSYYYDSSPHARHAS